MGRTDPTNPEWLLFESDNEKCSITSKERGGTTGYTVFQFSVQNNHP